MFTFDEYDEAMNLNYHRNEIVFKVWNCTSKAYGHFQHNTMIFVIFLIVTNEKM